MKKLWSLWILVWLFAVPAFGKPDRGAELFDIFLRELRPERATMILSSRPRENGRIPQICVDLENATVAGMRLHRVMIDGYDVYVSPPEVWPHLRYPKIRSILACHGRAVITEEDVNCFLTSRAFGDHREWEEVQVRFTGEKIRVSCYYRLDLKIIKLRIKLDLITSLGVRNGSELWLEDTRVLVNNSEIPDSLIRQGLSKLQPILDLNKFMLPVDLAKVEIQEGQLIVRSRRPARTFPGIVYSWPKITPAAEKAGRFSQ